MLFDNEELPSIFSSLTDALKDQDARDKAASRVAISSSLLSISLTIFTLIWGFDKTVKMSGFLYGELAFAMALQYYSAVAYSKTAYKQVPAWKFFALWAFITGFSLLMSVIGIMIYIANQFGLSLAYFGAIWFLDILYSYCDCMFDGAAVGERVFKTSFFIIFTACMGLVPIIID